MTTPHKLTAEDYFPDRLKKLREGFGYSQEAVAQRVGVTRMMIYLAERDEVSFRLLKALADLYRVPYKHLLRDSGPAEIILPPAVKTA